MYWLCFFFQLADTTQISTLPLHDALPISERLEDVVLCDRVGAVEVGRCAGDPPRAVESAGGSPARSEEHTSELQSLTKLVCRLLLEKKNARRTAEPLLLTTLSVHSVSDTE